ncbi:Zinc finger protein [Pseudolycoriella hygida]|uniref:Zinc finger protein n=1 Tax=Pseudolycoriella hygida TaxID=35572 RepID=A0A9Q0N5L8_9DIPT|nr:Zinc finger protein [Pseudolycoriella hygida]
MLIEDFPNSRTTFHGFTLLNHQQPILYPITPPHHHSPPYQDFRGRNEIDHRHMNHQDESSYNFQKLHYYTALTPSTYYPTLYPSPPQSISPPSQALQQLISYRKHSNANYESGSEHFMLTNDSDTYNRRNSVIMKVQDQVIVPSFKLNTPPVPATKVTSDSDEENFVCKWISCFSIFDTLEALATHVTQCHAVASLDGLYHCKWHACPRSDRGFNARYKMLVHVRTHTKEKPHSCDQCPKSFSRAENLKIHIRSHSGEKPYQCPVEGCNKAYSNSSDRFKHTRTHSTEKPYFCKVPGCNKRYTDPSSLRKHVKTFKHLPHSLDTNPLAGNEIETRTNQTFPYQEKSVVEKPAYKCIHECCKQLRKSEMFQLGHLMDNVTIIGPNAIPFKYHGATDNGTYPFESEWNKIDEPLDLSIHKVVRS